MDQKVASPSGQSAASSLTATLDRLAPYALSILRIMAALLFLEHGTSKFFDFPQVMEPFPVFSMEWFAGLIEFAGGILVALGLFTRAAALIMSGEMAIGYFLFHAPLGFFPMLNRGDAAILYCFVFLIWSSPAPDRGASTRCCGNGEIKSRGGFVTARSEATKQSGIRATDWIASRSLSSGRPLRAGPVGSQRRGGARRDRYLIPSSSTSNIRVAFGGMTLPAPCAP
jgi:putative oxidoreductase